MLRPLIILFAKAPIAERTKTRLCPPLTLAEAAALHAALMTDTGNMLMKLERGLSAGRKTVMVLGSDSPGLPLAYVTELLRSTAGVTLGSTPDGGFFAMVCRAVHRDMFAGVRWSGEYALADVERQASACGLSVALGPAWFDGDVEADMLRLLDMPDLPDNTAVWARR